jgi:M6 family metalloprotease-like protein
MPPLDAGQMAKYSAFVNKKAALRSAAAGKSGLKAPSRSFSESRPYEGLRPALGVHKVLALLVDFDDRPYYSVDAKKRSSEYYGDILFSESRNSMNRYYKQASKGKLSFAGGVLKVAAGAGAGAYWHRSLKPYREWGSDLEAFEIIDSSDISYLASEVIENASRYIDFGEYDADRDGVISPYELHIIIFHSGGGQERTADSRDIWSHRSTLETPVKAGGVIIDSYILLAHDSPLGVLCHETGHDLGLFDIYDTHSGDSVLGSWTLMDRGAWNGVFPKTPGSTPALLSAYERIALGWIKPHIAGAAREEVYLRSVSSGRADEKLNGYPVADAVKIEVAATNGTEYLLFENRYKMPDSYDEDIPPLLKRENGVLVYHVNEKMPDKAAYQYANDSRNSFYRLRMAPPESGGHDLSYYSTEFSRYSSKLKSFYNGSPNLYRMNCIEAAGEFAKVIFNAPPARINKYEAAFTNNSFALKASFSHYNSGISRLSANLFIKRESAKDGGAASQYYSETPLVENEAVTGYNYFKSIDSKNMILLESDDYFIRFVLTDGEYKEERIFGPMRIKSGRTKYMRIFPAAVNKGAVSINVYYSDNASKGSSVAASDTEEVYYSYIDEKGYGIKKRILEYETGGSLWNYRTYKFYAGPEVASDIKISVVSSAAAPEELTGEVRLIRSAPRISHGVYLSALLENNITIMAESDRVLFQAQLLIAETGRDTISVSMYGRGAGSNIYYYNYKPRGGGVIYYSLNCVDTAGNASETPASAYIFKAPLASRVSRFAFEDGTIELSFAGLPVELNGRDAYISVNRAGGGVVNLKIMPEEYNRYAPAGGGVGFKIAVKADFKNKNYAIRPEGGVNFIRRDSGGRFELPAFGRYDMYETIYSVPAAEVSGGSFQSAAVPNPSRSSVKITSLNGAHKLLWPLKLKIYDSDMRPVESFDDYAGGFIAVGGYSNGVYFYSLEGGGSKTFSKFIVRR